MIGPVTERIHDDEPDTSEPVVRELLAQQCPQWSLRPIEYLRTSGTDNALWRVRLDDSPDVVVRLPRRRRAAQNVDNEIAVLRLVQRSPVAAIVVTPRVRHLGEPHELFPHPWSVLEWIEGSDAWAARHEPAADTLRSLAADLGRVVLAIGRLSDPNLPRRRPGDRGGPLEPLLNRLEGWLHDPDWHADSLVDVAAVKRLIDQARDVVDEPVSEGFVHGDLIPGNVLVDRGRLQAVLDWGAAGCGDLSQDLAPAWSILTARQRPIFREIIDPGGAAWIRGRAFELEHAVGGVLYYVPRNHPLGRVMSRTLARILTDI